jgi:tetratricopeptide (TPR) repeat protein
MSRDSYDDDLDDFDAPPSFFTRFRFPLIAGAIVLVVLFLGMRVLRGSGGQASTERTAQHLTLKNAEERFSADPTNADTTAQAVAAFEAAGQHAKAEEIKRRHDAAVASKGHAAEQQLRDRLARDPKDADAFGKLLALLVQDKRTDEGRLAYEAFVQADPTPQKRAGLGAWLWRNGYPEDAEHALRDALKAGDTSPHTHGYLGLALFDLGRKEEAKKELNTALDGDLDQDEVRRKLILLEPDDDTSDEEKPAAPAPTHHKAKAKKKKKK